MIKFYLFVIRFRQRDIILIEYSHFIALVQNTTTFHCYFEFQIAVHLNILFAKHHLYVVSLYDAKEDKSKLTLNWMKFKIC